MSSRPIRSVFYQRNEAVRTNHSKWANTAVPNAVGHLQLRRYDATHCEVFDSSTGELHAVLKVNMKGDIAVLFKREVKEGM